MNEMKPMKRVLTIFAILLSCATLTMAQQGPGKRIHAAKMAYITDRIKLTQEQMAGFMPLYGDYEKELRIIRQEFFKKYRGADKEQKDDAGARKYIEDDLDYQQQVISLKRKYNDTFLKVLTARQLADLYKAEREFRQMLMQQLKHNYR